MFARTIFSPGLCVALSSALVVAGFTGAAAESAAETGEDAAEYGDSIIDAVVVTGTGREARLLDQAGNTGRVTRRDIDLIRQDHISEALNRVSGVMLQRGNGQENLTAIRSPVLTGGAGAGSFLFMEDGVPLRASGFANLNGLFEVNAEQAGAIEIVRGPGSALYGSNAVHGLVNVLTRAPSPKPERLLDFSAGPHGLWRLKAGLSNTVGAHAYRISVSAQRDGGWRADSGFNQQKATLRHDFSGGRDSLKTVLSLQNLDQETAGFVFGKNAYKDKILRRGNVNPEAFRDAKSLRLSLRWDRQLAGNRQLSLTPYARYQDMEFLMHFLPGKALEENRHKSIGLLAAFYQDFPAGHQVVLGADLELTDGFLKENQSNPTVFSFTQGTHYDYSVIAFVAAPYIHSEWQLAEKLRLTAGLRFEYVSYDYDNKTDDGVVGRFKRVADRKDTYSNATPKLGLVYSFLENFRAYVNLARAARAPQTTDAYRLQRRQEVGDVRSERLDSAEVGLRGAIEIFGGGIGGGPLTYDLAAYFMRKKNFFFRDVDGFNVANGRTRHAGMELELYLPLARGFDVSANGTYARHTYNFTNEVSSRSNSTEAISDGDDVDTAPRLVSNIRLGWSREELARVELEWLHVSGYYTDAANLHRYGGHDLLNFRAEYEVTARFALHARLTNLLDRAYAERADYFFGTDRYFPGEGRALHLGASLSF